LGDSVEKTRVVERTLTPEWNDEFVLEVHNHTSTLRVSLFDHDFNKEDHIGDCLIPLAQVYICDYAFTCALDIIG
jgi:Ca2+-dependent lipid-binding protein